jgi:hypothetical protein
MAEKFVIKAIHQTPLCIFKPNFYFESFVKLHVYLTGDATSPSGLDLLPSLLPRAVL